MFTYPLDQIPFSTRGSFLTITSRNSSGSSRLLYKTCSGRAYDSSNAPFPADEFFELSLIRDGKEIPYTWQAYPYRLDLNADAQGNLTLTFVDPETLIFEARGVGLRLLPCKKNPIEYSQHSGQICLVDWPARGVHMFQADENTQLTSTITPTITSLDKHWGENARTFTFEPFPNATNIKGELRFTGHETLWDEPIPDFAKVLSTQENFFKKWMRNLPDVPETYQIPAEIAWFILWSCQVPAQGALTRPAIYMSKFWMNAIWSWDNCFNAIAVAHTDPQLAWDQILLFFDLQDPNGILPDMITDLESIYGFTKPPIYGWAIRKLVDKLGLKKSLPYLNAIYKPLGRLTNWWYTLRDYDQDGLPQYHHGNDSGWDNATIFDQGFPTEGADLAAYLVLQCECLATIAQALGHNKGAARWKARADKQLNDLLSHSVIDNHFFSPLIGNVATQPSSSLINYLPLILGKRLPKPIRKALIADLGPNGPFLTPFGLASEAPDSPKYKPDGYWRGPIWAASTYLLFDGLLESDETDLARTIAERFCNMCLREPGFWENYDALTGKGLRCPGYSWTASVFLLLAEWLAQNKRRK